MAAPTYKDVLANLGFQSDENRRAALQTHAENPETDGGNLSHNGDYKVLGTWTKDDIVVHMEQNTAPDQIGELSAIVTHPPLLVVEGPKGRAAVRPGDVEALEQVIADLS